MAARRRPKERIGFGEPTLVRDHPGILVVEETHFPAGLWWSLLSAGWLGIVLLGGVSWSWGVVAGLLAAYAFIMLPLLLVVSLQGYQRLSIRDGESITATRVPHLGRPSARRLPLESVDFVSCDTHVRFSEPGESGSEVLIVTAHLKDGRTDSLLEVPFSRKVAIAIEAHLPGLCASDVHSGVHTPP